MGRGCAKQALNRYPLLNQQLGSQIKAYGNTVRLLNLPTPGEYLIAFPVKHNWWEQADLSLIEQSAKRLRELMDDGFDNGWPTDDLEAICAVPRPGCGNGGLNWDEVRPVIEPYFDDRFVVVTLA